MNKLEKILFPIFSISLIMMMWVVFIFTCFEIQISYNKDKFIQKESQIKICKSLIEKDDTDETI
jgi:hypothetical protein